MINKEFKKIQDIVNKINILIGIYVKKEGLEPYLNKTKMVVLDGSVDVYKISVIKYCSESNDINMRDFYETLRSFVSNTELENQLAARYLPDYLTIKNILDILLYEIPRKIQKSDLELLNKLYKKYNVKF